MFERDWLGFDPDDPAPGSRREARKPYTPEEYDALIDALDVAQLHYGTEGDLMAGRASAEDRAVGRDADRRFTILERIRRALGDPGADPDVAVPDRLPDDMG
jgi:hypothetical protein